MADLRIRFAEPYRDAAAVTEIYRPAVEETIASFEEVVPSPEEMAARIAATLDQTPWLMAELGGHVAGYAYAGPHRDRAGYRWSVNVSVYVAATHQGRGVGRRLYERLFALLRRQRFVNAYAGIALPNAASVALHERVGMRRTALYERVGYKFGAWHDVAWYALRLTDPPSPPPEPIPVSALQMP